MLQPNPTTSYEQEIRDLELFLNTMKGFARSASQLTYVQRGVPACTKTSKHALG